MLHVHRSERADHLVETLADVLEPPLPDPMATEVVSVPTRGVERWLSQRLSHRLGRGDSADGVCANVDFPFPASLIGRVTSAACGIDQRRDPWLPERSVWPLLRVVDACFEEEWLRPLAEHLRAAWPSAEPGKVRRFAAVRHLADLYDHYGVHRPEMVRTWLDGATTSERPAEIWQSELWRRLREHIGVESPAERLRYASDRIVADPDLVDLPQRVSLFGLTRLPASHLTVLEAMASGRDVHLFLLHPSGVLWDSVAEHVGGIRPGIRRADDPSASLPVNPLLRSWGRDAREMQLVLAGHGAQRGEYRPVDAGAGTLLGRIQADIRADQLPPGAAGAGTAGGAGAAGAGGARRSGATGEGVGAAEAGEDARLLLGPGDKSVRIHACHGRARQVEVTRDAVLHLLASDPTLEPRDVIVMCPDIETFAPLVHATFGSDDEELSGEPNGTTPQLRVRLADRSLRQTNPLLAVADYLLELASGRVTASQVLDLASREPVRRRFRFDDDDLSQIERWVIDMGVRWGLDADHRAAWGLGGLATGTWDAGLDRLLLGAAMPDEEQRLFAGRLPIDDVSGSEVDLAGRLAELVQRLDGAVRRLQVSGAVDRWTADLLLATEALASVAGADMWQRDQLHRVLDEVVDESRGAAPAGSPSLDLAEVRSLLAHRLKGRPTRANFRTGDLTICTLVPMRSVPHRVVCLLGLDDGVFPRHTERDGDDLLLDDPHVGDREARSEDRQLLLDAVLAATDHLVITYTGHDERTNHERAPAVPISELLDVIDRTARTDSGPARETVVVHHPLQSFDPRNFTAGDLGESGAWSFDWLNLDGARALCGDRSPPGAFLRGTLPPLREGFIQLDSLVRFVEHPVKSFLRDRLGVYAGGGTSDVDDALPIELDPLAKWAVGDRLLSARLAGVSAEDAELAERARGFLPPGVLGEAVLAEVSPMVDSLAGAVAGLPCGSGAAVSRQINLVLPDDRILIGTVPGVRGDMIVRCIYSSLSPKHRVASWVRFLALSAARPERPISAVTIGRSQRKSGGRRMIGLSVLEPFPGTAEERRAAALSQLEVVVDLFDRGMLEPLPLYCGTSAAWAESDRSGGDARQAAEREWTPGYGRRGEDEDPEHLLVLGRKASLQDLLSEAARSDERGPGWDETERSRFARLAHRLWDGLLAHERKLDS